MDNDRMLIDKLRQEVLSGRITYDDIVKRLTIAIETEYLKDSPNIDFIESCEDFLWEIRATEEQKYVSVKDRYLKVIGQHTKVATPIHSRNTSSVGFAKRIALVCTAFVVLICLTQGAIRFRWFSQNSSSDEQQYIIEGHNVNIDLIMNSIAEHDHYATMKTHDWKEFCEFLGFIPTIIDPSALSATDTQYTAFVEPEVIMLIIKYTLSTTDETVVMTIYHYTDIEDAFISFEQDNEGEHIDICGTSVYTSSNIEANSFTWIVDSTVYKVAGSISIEKSLSILENIVGACSHE
ncbi:MAG: hypothetical protein PUC00_05550 [Clostridiales bacterium]|nr:hypothetical protein [Clostridiales bacterium]